MSKTGENISQQRERLLPLIHEELAENVRETIWTQFFKWTNVRDNTIQYNTIQYTYKNIKKKVNIFLKSTSNWVIYQRRTQQEIPFLLFSLLFYQQRLKCINSAREREPGILHILLVRGLNVPNLREITHFRCLHLLVLVQKSFPGK